jgi:aryl-alcohol dehydrogenase-like predicted oxidoreductase
MQTRQLGNSDLMITPLGVGSWAMGGAGWAFAWGPQDDADSIAAIRAGLEAGLNWIDTAAVYGLGHSEEVVGKAVEGISPKPYVFTKCARWWNDKREIVKTLKSADLRKQCEESLQRLKTDVIDLFQVHWPEPAEDIDEGWETMIRLKEEGKIRWAGVSNFNAAQLKQISKHGYPTSLQPPYSIVSPEIEEEALPYCAANNIGVLAYSPMRNGLLSGKMTKERVAAMPEDDFRCRSPFFQEPNLTRNLALADKLREIGTRHGRTCGETAIAWTLRRPEVTAAIVGVRSPEQWKGVLGAATFRLSEGEIRELAEFRAGQAATTSRA